MPADIRKITESRKAEREATSLEHRGALALELIADTLEAVRIELVLIQSVMSRLPPR